MIRTFKLAKERILSKASNGSQQSDFNSTAATLLKNVSVVDKAFFFSMLDSNESGISITEVKERQLKYGLNELAHEKAPAWYIQFLQAFINPFIGILIVIAIVSLITDVFLAEPGDRDYKTVIVVFIMVMLSSLLRFWQEFRSNNAAEKLKGMVKTTATV